MSTWARTAGCGGGDAWLRTRSASTTWCALSVLGADLVLCSAACWAHTIGFAPGGVLQTSTSWDTTVALTGSVAMARAASTAAFLYLQIRLLTGESGNGGRKKDTVEHKSCVAVCTYICAPSGRPDSPLWGEDLVHAALASVALDTTSRGPREYLQPGCAQGLPYGTYKITTQVLRVRTSSIRGNQQC